MRSSLAAVTAGLLAIGASSMVALGAPLSAQADPTHSSYNGLASTPPMGFND